MIDYYQKLVPDAMRGQPFRSLAKRVSVERLTGSYYFTNPEIVINAYTQVMIIDGSGNDIKAKITSPTDTSKFILSDIRVENSKLIFKARNDAWGDGQHFWGVAEYVADLKGDLKKIPWIATQTEGNVGPSQPVDIRSAYLTSINYDQEFFLIERLSCSILKSSSLRMCSPIVFGDSGYPFC